MSQINKFILKNSHITVEVLNYGCIIHKLIVDGTDIVCGYDNVRDYLSDTTYQGATIGRYANRIAKGKYTHHNKEYVLSQNENNTNHLHGGFAGFNTKYWSLKESDSDAEQQSITLWYVSMDGEEGYPGNLTAEVKYTLRDRIFEINYKAISDKDTPISLTNHNYYNLAGITGDNVLGHSLQINSDFVSTVDTDKIPVGVMRVDNTIFDLRAPKHLADVFNQATKEEGNGIFDHNYFISSDNTITSLSGYILKEACILSTDSRKMTLFTDLPCVQFYTGNYLSADTIFKNNTPGKKHLALCLETQYEPNGPNNNIGIQRAHELYNKTTQLVFDYKIGFY